VGNESTKFNFEDAEAGDSEIIETGGGELQIRSEK
jgi:hypothetical protein